MAGDVPIWWCRIILGVKNQGRVFITKGALTFVTTQTLGLGFGGKQVDTIAMQDIDSFAVSNPNSITITYKASGNVGNFTATFTPLGFSAGRIVDLIEAVSTANAKHTIKFTDGSHGGLLYMGDIGDNSFTEEEEEEDEFIVLTRR